MELLTDWDPPNATIPASCHGKNGNGPVSNAVWCKLEERRINRDDPDNPRVRVATRPRDKWIALEVLHGPTSRS